VGTLITDDIPKAFSVVAQVAELPATLGRRGLADRTGLDPRPDSTPGETAEALSTLRAAAEGWPGRAPWPGASSA
jgi:hypothetical protein